MPKLNKPTVVDADALTIYAKSDYKLPTSSILTPHLGELRRLLDDNNICCTDEASLKKVKNFCTKHKLIVLVKGYPSFVVSYNHQTTILAVGDPGMATAGSGDVLTGVICSFLAQGLAPYEATCLGTYLHGQAGSQAAQELGSDCLLYTSPSPRD